MVTLPGAMASQTRTPLETTGRRPPAVRRGSQVGAWDGGAPEGDGEWPGAGHLWLAGGGDFLAVWSSKVPQLAQGPPWAGGNRCLTAVPAVTSSDELWAVGPSGYLLQRLTKMFRHSRSTLKSGQATTPHLEELEDEWEVI